MSNPDTTEHTFDNVSQSRAGHDEAPVAESTPPEIHRPARPGDAELALACQLRSAAAYLAEHAEKSAAVLLLNRAEVLLLHRALRVQQSLPARQLPFTEEELDPTQVFQKTISEDLTDAQVSALRAALGPCFEFELPGMTPQRRRETVAALWRLERALLAEATSVRRPWPHRKKLGFVAATIAVMLFGGIVIASAIRFRHRWTRPNLALHKPVRISSTLGGEFVDGTKLVNGDTSDVGFHTQSEVNPFAIIDLGQSQTISEIVVHNRKDCCQERAIPLRIEVSDDGSKYLTVAERNENFETWIAKDLQTKGRYVRLRLDATSMFHLAEVEIY